MAARKAALGKGLDSLIPDKIQSAPESKTKIVEKIVEKPVEMKVKISKVGPNKGQPRKSFDEDSLRELADSIKQFGVIQPLVVREINGFYEIIAGERRWRAAKLAGLKEVPVIVKDYTELETMEISLIENIQRENLNPIEEATAYKRLLEEFNLKQEEVAERVSKSRTAVTNSLRLLKLDSRVQQMVIDGQLSTGHARALLSIDDKDDQAILAEKIVKDKLSVREVEKLVKKAQNGGGSAKKSAPVNDFIYNDLENRLKTATGTKVSIKQKAGGKGTVEIEYYSGEDLDRIVGIITSAGVL